MKLGRLAYQQPFPICQVLDILESLATNIKSGLSYSGARSIRELQAKAKFIEQTLPDNRKVALTYLAGNEEKLRQR